MRPRRRRPLRAALLLAALLAAAPARARTVVLLPLPGSIVTEDGGLVLGFCDDPGKTEVDIVLNDKPHRVELWDGVFDLDLDWAQGTNRLTVNDQSLSFTLDAYADAPRAPSVHQAAADNCGNCHVLGEERSLALRGDLEALCLGCHKKALGAFAHRGAACGSCHAAHTSWEPHLLKSGDNATCTACHATAADTAKTAHGGVWGKASCRTCHVPHAPRASNTGKACTACHADVGTASPAHADAVKGTCEACHLMHGPKGGPKAKAPADSCATCHVDPGDARHRKALAECGACHGLHREKEQEGQERFCRPCHEPIFAKKRLHGPDSVGDCAVCHPLHDVRNRSPAVFSCTQCHGPEKLEGGHTGAVVAFNTCVVCHRLHESEEASFLPKEQHTPFRERRCADCHGKPGAFGPDRKLKGSAADLCRSCHADESLGRLSHGPAAEGQCRACHDPHASSWKAQALAPPRALCGTCHEEVAAAFRGRHAALGCADCHAPHGGDNDHHLRRSGNALCTTCHRDPTLDVGGVAKPTVHGPLNTAGCALCHDPHGGSGKHLRKAQGEMCGDCHDVAEPSAVAKTGARVHAPVARGACTACHEPHASRGKALLKAEGDALCLGCHDLKRHSHTLAERPASKGAVVPADWPRDGARFACSGCHRPHASPVPRLLIRERSQLCKSCHKGV